MNYKTVTSAISMLLLVVFNCPAQNFSESELEKYLSGKEDRLERLNEEKFGMFIHWGPYAILAGEYQEKRIPALGEWIMFNAKIPIKEYEEMASTFNPQKFNAEEWAKIANEAGMKYMVITPSTVMGLLCTIPMSQIII